jgi:uncharacterized protein YdeI (YjbR/CyaY-like superfamily)
MSPSASQPKPAFFRDPAALRAWFAAHHECATELWVGYYKKETGRASITWPESVDEALCVGWIDGLRKSLGHVAYMIRFSPRKRTSIWSAINIRRVGVLRAGGRMRPAGLKAFGARRENRSGIYAYEQRSAEFPAPYDAEFRKHRAAWTYFQSRPPGYRKSLGWWVVSAKREETRRKRLAELVAHSAAKRVLPETLKYRKQ